MAIKTILTFNFLLIIQLGLYSQSKKPKWDYPVKPSNKEWVNLKSNAEKVNICQIPTHILTHLNTNELILICLKYPLINDIYAFNNISDGMQKFESDFNGFRELKKRTDAGELLLNEYTKNSILNIPNSKSIIEIGNYIIKYSLIEIFMSDLKILNNTKSEIKEQIITSLLKNKVQKQKLTNFHYKIGMQTNYFALGRVLYSKKELTKSNCDNETVNFVENGGMPTVSTLENIDKIIFNRLKTTK